MAVCSLLIELVSPFAGRENVDEQFSPGEHSLLHLRYVQHSNILCLWLLPQKKSSLIMFYPPTSVKLRRNASSKTCSKGPDWRSRSLASANTPRSSWFPPVTSSYS